MLIRFIIIFILSNAIATISWSNEFTEEKAAYKTKLIKTIPAPQPYTEEQPPTGVELITYDSNGLKLKAWFAKPATKTDKKIPAIVYLHGGFSFGKQDFLDAQVFLENGFALLTPMLRGENGNPGHFEFLYGEVDDALAAVDWLQNHPDVDRSKIFIFGHSIGGAVADLTSLYKKEGVLLSGSAGALYSPELFYNTPFPLPFDNADQKEVKLRSFAFNLKYMERKHAAYVSKQDLNRITVKLYGLGTDKYKNTLKVSIIEKDHYALLRPAMLHFIKGMKAFIKTAENEKK